MSALAGDLVSVVIPCFNPQAWLLEAVASIRAQTHQPIELILVNDGSNNEEALTFLDQAAAQADVYLEQPNRGLPAARNAGFRAAKGLFVLPLDSDDVLDRRYVAACMAAAGTSSDSAFVYADCRVFGERNYVERYEEYNLYTLLDRNVLPYAALIRKEAWLAVAGYDEQMRLGCEDWEFWLRLGANGRYGTHIAKTLFHYRKHGPSLFDVARRHECEIREYIRAKHPDLYNYESRARIKATWQPAACMVGPVRAAILDCDTAGTGSPREILRQSRAPAFAISTASSHPSAAELAALAVWGGNHCVQLQDGSLAASREVLEHCQSLAELSPDTPPPEPGNSPSSPGRFSHTLGTLHRHLFNAGLLSPRAWLKHPLQSVIRLIPLRIKEEFNRLAGHPIFDLSFYLQFQPATILLDNKLNAPLSYFPPLDSRRRVALITPHLGSGGAEKVLFDIACALDTARFEVFLIATQTSDSRWRDQWTQKAGHVYDLAALVPAERVPGALYSIVRNWRLDTLLIQNTLQAYSVIRQLKTDLPSIRIMDLVHSVDEKWDVVSATGAIAGLIDTRIVISEAARARLRRFGSPEAGIRLIRNGIDLTRFPPLVRPPESRRLILFAGRLDPVKRPHLLIDIAVALKKRRGGADFRVIVAGDGPEGSRLREQARKAGVAESFDFLGHVPDIAPLLAEADLLVLPSRTEGIPIVVLEAFAAGKPVVVSDAGAVHEVVDSGTGFLISNGPGESEAFAEAIHTLLESQELRQAMGLKARRKVENEYSLDAFRRAYRELFDVAALQNHEER